MPQIHTSLEVDFMDEMKRVGEVLHEVEQRVQKVFELVEKHLQTCENIIYDLDMDHH